MEEELLEHHRVSRDLAAGQGAALVSAVIMRIDNDGLLKVYAFFSLFVVILSTVIFILSTQPELDEFHDVGTEQAMHQVTSLKHSNCHIIYKIG